MGNFFARAFYKLWPHQQKQTETQEGDHLRCVLGFATIMHIFLFVGCLTLVGFGPMIYNLLQFAWAYSCYLTLREREIVVYFIMLAGFAILETTTIFDKKKEGNWQQLGSMTVVILYCLIGYIVGRTYYFFRITGGLHGRIEGIKQARKPLLKN